MFKRSLLIEQAETLVSIVANEQLDGALGAPILPPEVVDDLISIRLKLHVLAEQVDAADGTWGVDE